MAELAEYQQMLRDGIKAGAAGDKRNKYLAHLAQYGEDAPFYGGKAQFGNLQIGRASCRERVYVLV